jgi:outer membrane usher protein
MIHNHGVMLKWLAAMFLSALLISYEQTQVLAEDINTDLASTEKIEVILPVFIDGEPSGDIFTVIEEQTGIIQLDAPTLIDAFKQVLSEDVVNHLIDLRGASNHITSEDLLLRGITVRFNSETVVLEIHTPLLARKKQLHNLHSRQQKPPASAIKAIRPVSVSAAVDLFMVQAWRRNEHQPTTGEVDAYFNLYDWILHNRQAYNESVQRRWQRRQTRLTRDWPERWQRLAIGDVNYKSMGLMGNRPLSGVSLGTLFELQPYSVTYPLSRYEFFLEQDSLVDVYINGNFRMRLRLSAGQHDIQDLPLIQGINQVTLKITDSMGRTSTIEFFDTLEQRLLQPGLNEYSLTLGVPHTTDHQHGIDYDTELPTLSAFYRTGLSENQTLGAHLEASEKIIMGGATGILNGLWGTLSYDTAVSRDSTEEITDFGGIADYLLYWQGWRINALYRWEGQSFANLNQDASDNNTHYNARFGLTFPKVYDWICNLSLTQAKRWKSEKRRSQRIALSRSYPYGWRLSLDFSHHQSSDNKSESEASLQVYWAPSNTRIHSSLSYTSPEHAQLAEVRYQRPGELGLDARIFHFDSDRQHLNRVETSYHHSRLTSRLSVSQNHPNSGDSIDTQSLRLATALAYADGHLAISRPLHGQPFALLSGKASLGDHKVSVIRGLGNQPSVILNGAGATAVLPNLSPYYTNQVNLDVHELPIGMQIEQDNYTIVPSYHSGASLEVGIEGHVYLIGRLVDSKHQPLGYVVGQLFASKKSSKKPVVLFTDKQGHFEVAGLVPGRYTIRLDAPYLDQGELIVPEGSYGILEMGDVVLKQQ